MATNRTDKARISQKRMFTATLLDKNRSLTLISEGI